MLGTRTIVYYRRLLMDAWLAATAFLFFNSGVTD